MSGSNCTTGSLGLVVAWMESEFKMYSILRCDGSHPISGHPTPIFLWQPQFQVNSQGLYHKFLFYIYTLNHTQKILIFELSCPINDQSFHRVYYLKKEVEIEMNRAKLSKSVLEYYCIQNLLTILKFNIKYISKQYVTLRAYKL